MDTEKPFDSIQLLRLILHRKKFIGLLFVLSVILAAVFTSPFFIPPLYSSEAIIYPSATNSNKMLTDYDLHFGTDKEIDEHIQILKSGILRDSMTRKYNLMSRYGIDKNDKAKHDLLYKIYSKRIGIDRTRHNAIAVTVFDTNADTAALIANDLVSMGDRVKENILKNNFRLAYQSLDEQYQKVKNDVDSILVLIRKQDDANYVPEINAQSKIDFAERLIDKIDIRQSMKRAHEKNNQSLVYLLKLYESKLSFLTDLQEKHYETGQKLSNAIPGSYVITPGEVADKKSYPVRSVIVIIAGLSSILLGISLTFAAEWLKKLKHKL